MQIKEYVFEIMLKSYPLKDKIILYRIQMNKNIHIFTLQMPKFSCE